MTVNAGDIVVVRTPDTAGWFIRLGAWLSGRPTGGNHVVIVTDASGNIIEATPHGIRRSNLSAYSRFRQENNAKQPKTIEQRATIVKTAEAFLGDHYDWEAISEDASNVFGINDPFIHEWLPGTVPAKFVCSSLASYVYSKILPRLEEPVGGRFCTPGDWSLFIEKNGFNQD